MAAFADIAVELAAYGVIYPGLLYVMMRFFFPRVFLVPVMVIAGVLYIAMCLARFQVVLDRTGGEVAITAGMWTRHVRLTQVERVKVLWSGTEIRIAGGITYRFGPFWRHRWLRRLLPVRSGFEQAGLDALIRITPVTRPPVSREARAAGR